MQMGDVPRVFCPRLQYVHKACMFRTPFVPGDDLSGLARGIREERAGVHETMVTLRLAGMVRGRVLEREHENVMLRRRRERRSWWRAYEKGGRLELEERDVPIVAEGRQF